MEDITVSLNKLSILAALMFGGACFMSCTSSTPEKQIADEPPASAHSPEPVGKHWVQDEQLRRLMIGMSAKSQQDWPKDVPQNPEDADTGNLSQTMNSAAKLADGLASSAMHIPDGIVAKMTSEADRAGFQAQADVLHSQAVRLGQVAREGNVEQLQRSLDSINATCISCHSRYRDFSGQLDFPRAAAK
jgi:soluble cytochrome b562